MEIIILKDAQKYLDKMPRHYYERIMKVMKSIVEEQYDRTYDIKPMAGYPKGYFRLKTPPYRVIFKVEYERIIISKVGMRGDIYKK